MVSRPRYDGQTIDERRQERRGLLIQAATRLYGRRGYRHTGVRAVCQEAGLTERYFYESFANSEALLEAAFDAAVNGLIAEIRSVADPGLPASERGRFMLGAYYGRIRDNPDAARVFLIETTGVSPTIDMAFERSLEQFTELILDINDPRRIGPLAVDPLLRRGIAGGLLHIALGWLGAGYDRPLDEVVATATLLCELAVPCPRANGKRPAG